MMKLLINGVEVDLPNDAEIIVDYFRASEQEAIIIAGQVTIPISLPATEKNNRLFYANDVQVFGAFNRQDCDAEIIAEGIQIFVGRFALEQATKDNYTGRLYGEEAAWFSRIEGKTLKELQSLGEADYRGATNYDGSDQTFTFNWYNDRQHIVHGIPINFPQVAFGNYFDYSGNWVQGDPLNRVYKLRFTEVPPSFYIVPILKAIFRDANLNIAGEILQLVGNVMQSYSSDSEFQWNWGYFSRVIGNGLLQPNPSAYLVSNPPPAGSFSTDFTRNPFGYLTIQEFDDEILTLPNANRYAYGVVSEFSSVTDGAYRIAYNATFTQNPNPNTPSGYTYGCGILVRVYDTSNTVISEKLLAYQPSNTGVAILGGQGSIGVFTGDRVEVIAFATNYIINVDGVPNTARRFITIRNRIDARVIGMDKIDLAANLPNIQQSEFVRSFCYLFGCYLDYHKETNTVYFKQFSKDRLAIPTNIIDLTDYADEREAVIKPPKLFQTMRFKVQDDKDPFVPNTGQFETDVSNNNPNAGGNFERKIIWAIPGQRTYQFVAPSDSGSRELICIADADMLQQGLDDVRTKYSFAPRIFQYLSSVNTPNRVDMDGVMVRDTTLFANSTPSIQFGGFLSMTQSEVAKRYDLSQNVNGMQVDMPCFLPIPLYIQLQTCDRVKVNQNTYKLLGAESVDLEEKNIAKLRLLKD